MLSKVIYVKANFLPIGEEKIVSVPTGEQRRDFLGREKEVFKKERRWVQTDCSDCLIDGAQLAADMQGNITTLINEG